MACDLTKPGRKIRIAGTVNDSITDGPGIRYTIFTQGCPHHCPACHNPQTWAFDGGVDVGCDELLAEIKRNPLLKGVTFSGGEPLAQAAALLPLAQAVRDMGLELAIYTGYTFEQLLKLDNPDIMALLALADTLIDGPFLLAERNLELNFRGSSNQRILNLPASLAQKKAVTETANRWY